MHKLYEMTTRTIKSMKKFILGGMTAMVMAFSVNAMAADFVAGKDYTVVQNPGKVSVPGKIEVREFFWYGCPHCFTLEPHMQAWLKKTPKDVNFIRTPAKPRWKPFGPNTHKSYSPFEAFHTSSNCLPASTI